MEGKLEVLRHPRLFEKCKLLILRTCNMLLRRLSKSFNAVLCGRVLIFLAKLFPLAERSGVNLHGTINLGNTTPIDDVEEVEG